MRELFWELVRELPREKLKDGLIPLRAASEPATGLGATDGSFTEEVLLRPGGSKAIPLPCAGLTIGLKPAAVVKLPKEDTLRGVASLLPAGDDSNDGNETTGGVALRKREKDS